MIGTAIRDIALVLIVLYCGWNILLWALTLYPVLTILFGFVVLSLFISQREQRTR